MIRNRRKFIPAPAYEVLALEGAYPGPDPLVRVNVDVREGLAPHMPPEPVTPSLTPTRPSHYPVPPYVLHGGIEGGWQWDYLLGRTPPPTAIASRPRGEEQMTEAGPRQNIRRPSVMSLGDVSESTGETLA